MDPIEEIDRRVYLAAPITFEFLEEIGFRARIVGGIYSYSSRSNCSITCTLRSITYNEWDVRMIDRDTGVHSSWTTTKRSDLIRIIES